MILNENTAWPPLGSISTKIQEHAAWYCGDADILAHYYHMQKNKIFSGVYSDVSKERFWKRALTNDIETGLHCPVAGDIASVSSDLLFAETPVITLKEANDVRASSSQIASQEELSTMLMESGFFKALTECSEVSAALGGVFIKLAWDSEISKYPIPVIEQPDNAIPEFTFGVLTSVTFWKEVQYNENKHKVYRLLETYDKSGSITYALHVGSEDKLGGKVDMSVLYKKGEYVDVQTNLKEILCVYIPNILPNRYFRGSWLGRSDYQGIEGMMDSLDETYSSWMRDIYLAQGRVLVPESYLQFKDGVRTFNVDKMLFKSLSFDPVSENSKITPVQFEIRSEQFEKTALNLLERIVSAAGYSPQTFGINIQGRAESGTALSIRERKTMSTKRKKETYFEQPIRHLVSLMMKLYATQLGGPLEADLTPTVQFNDSFTNDLSETSSAIQMLAGAQAISTEMKVKMLHTEWSDAEVMEEVSKILKENAIGQAQDPGTFSGDEEDQTDEEDDVE